MLRARINAIPCQTAAIRAAIAVRRVRPSCPYAGFIRRARRKEVNHDRTVGLIAPAHPPVWRAWHFRREGVFHCARGDPPRQPSRRRRNVTRPLTALTHGAGGQSPPEGTAHEAAVEAVSFHFRRCGSTSSFV